MSTSVAHSAARDTDTAEDYAAEIRAWMGRRGVRQTQLARALGENDQWLSIRLRGLTPVTVVDLARIARVLRVNVVDLLPYGEREVTLRYPQLAEFKVPAPPPVAPVGAYRTPLATAPHVSYRLPAQPPSGRNRTAPTGHQPSADGHSRVATRP